MFSSTSTPTSTSWNYCRFLLITVNKNSRASPSTASIAASASVWSSDGNRHGTYIQLGDVKKPFYDMHSTFQNSSSSCFRRWWWSSNDNGSSRTRRKKNGIFQLGDFQHLSAIAAGAAATSLAFFLSSTPGTVAAGIITVTVLTLEAEKPRLLSVHAGVLSGSSGLESVPPPEIPGLDFLKRIQEENQKKNEAYDGKFKSSPLLQELLKRSKANSERNKREIQDKYCERGAEWGVGDCSTVGMSREEREAFMEMLRKKRAPN